MRYFLLVIGFCFAVLACPPSVQMDKNESCGAFNKAGCVDKDEPPTCPMYKKMMEQRKKKECNLVDDLNGTCGSKPTNTPPRTH